MEIRGIIHAHSTYSYDGKLSLAELKSLCMQKGIQFVCMTEHVDEMTPESATAFVQECEALSDEKFCFIPGFEVPYKVNVEDREGALGYPPSKDKGHAHVLMIGMRDFLGNYAPTIDVLKRWTERAVFVVLAHPVRNDFYVDEGLLEGMHALEVWNQQYDGKRVPRTESLRLLTRLRARKQSLFALGGVDFHRSEHMGAPYITMEVSACTEVHILEKLSAGAFRVEGKSLHFYGTLPNVDALIHSTCITSITSVFIIEIGKRTNAFLARCGIRLPRILAKTIRRYL